MKKTIIMILIPLLLVITVQICLKNPKTRELFTDIEKYENISYGEITEGKTAKITFYKEGNANPEILFNGKSVAVLKEYKTTVTINCDGIFELENSSAAKVRVTVGYDDKVVNMKVINTECDTGINQICVVSLY